jgi:hypothetical protein
MGKFRGIIDPADFPIAAIFPITGITPELQEKQNS